MTNIIHSAAYTLSECTPRSVHNAWCSFHRGLRGRYTPRLNIQALHGISDDNLFRLIYATIPVAWNMTPREKANLSHHEVAHIIAKQGLHTLPAYTVWTIATRLDRFTFRVGRTIYELGYTVRLLYRWCTRRYYRLLPMGEHLRIQVRNIRALWTEKTFERGAVWRFLPDSNTEEDCDA